MKKKIIRILIILVSFILAYKIYESEYFIKANEYSIEKAIEEFLELDVSVLKYEKFQNVLIVYYEAADGNYDGSTVLYRGFNNRYQIRMAGYRTKNRVLSGRTFQSYGNKYLAIMGTNYNMLIDKVEIETNSNMIESFMTNGESYIIRVFKSKTEWDDSLKDYKLFDKKGNDITKQMNKIIYKKGGSSSGTGKAEFFLLYVYCFFIIIVGYFISRIFIEEKRDKKLDDDIL